MATYRKFYRRSENNCCDECKPSPCQHCDDTCEVTLSCETASDTQDKCGFNPFEFGGTYYTELFPVPGCSFPPDPNPGSALGTDAIAAAKRFLTWLSDKDGVDESEGCAGEYEPCTQTVDPDTCETDSPCSANLNFHNLLSDEFTDEMLFAKAIANLPSYSSGDVCEARKAFNAEHSNVIVKALRYTLNGPVDAIAHWNIVFTPASGGSPVVTPRSAVLTGGAFTEEIIPVLGDEDGTWSVEDPWCASAT